MVILRISFTVFCSAGLSTKTGLILVFVAFLISVLVMGSVDNFIFSETQENARFTAIPRVCSTS